VFTSFLSLSDASRVSHKEAPKPRRRGIWARVWEVLTSAGSGWNHPQFGSAALRSLHDSRLAKILAAMRQCLEASELERRIAETEAALTSANATTHAPAG
jgi:hypothetical protein